MGALEKSLRKRLDELMVFEFLALDSFPKTAKSLELFWLLLRLPGTKKGMKLITSVTSFHLKIMLPSGVFTYKKKTNDISI